MDSFSRYIIRSSARAVLLWIAVLALLVLAIGTAQAQGIKPGAGYGTLDPAHAGPGIRVADVDPRLAVSVQVSAEGRVAIVVLNQRPCAAPSAAANPSAKQFRDGYVVFDPVGNFEPTTDPAPGNRTVRLCWASRMGQVVLIFWRVGPDGREAASDPFIVPQDQFQIVDPV